MTTSPGWEPRPGPTRGDTARRPRPAVVGGWPANAPDGRRDAGPAGPSGRGRDDYDPRRQAPRGTPGEGPREPRFTESPQGTRGGGPGPGPVVPGGAREQRGGPGRRGTPHVYGRPRPGGGTPAGRSGAAPLDALDSLRSSPLLRWLGAISTRNAVLVLVAATLLGVVLTLIAGSEPGALLGFFITVGSVAAALGIRRGAVYLTFPMPAFAFFVAAVFTGKIHDSSLTSSTAGLGVGFLQWIADIFFPMVIATIAVLLVGGIRWVLAHQLVTGQFPMSAGRASASHGPRAAPGSRRPGGGDSWDGRSGRNGRAGADPRAPRPDRLPRDQRTDRDGWSDPRQPPADPRARGDGRDLGTAPPVTPGRGPGNEPRDRGQRPPGREPWAPRPQQPDQPPRPGRPQGPRDQWDQR